MAGDTAPVYLPPARLPAAAAACRLLGPRPRPRQPRRPRTLQRHARHLQLRAARPRVRRHARPGDDSCVCGQPLPHPAGAVRQVERNNIYIRFCKIFKNISRKQCCDVP